MSAQLVLLPNVLGEPFQKKILPKAVEDIFPTLYGIIVESEKLGRKYCLQYLSGDAYRSLEHRTLNEHTDRREIQELAHEIKKSQKTWGLVTDSGLSCLADPGSKLVFYLHQASVPVDAIAGPSSIFLALMLSGFSGQKFSFHGYLPRDEKELTKKLKTLDQTAKFDCQTQIWIETPYRNEKIIHQCVRSLHPETYFCVAVQIHTPEQKIYVKKIAQWKSMNLNEFKKKPAVFLLASSKN